MLENSPSVFKVSVNHLLSSHVVFKKILRPSNVWCFSKDLSPPNVRWDISWKFRFRSRVMVMELFLHLALQGNCLQTVIWAGGGEYHWPPATSCIRTTVPWLGTKCGLPVSSVLRRRQGPTSPWLVLILPLVSGLLLSERVWLNLCFCWVQEGHADWGPENCFWLSLALPPSRTLESSGVCLEACLLGAWSVVISARHHSVSVPASGSRPFPLPWALLWFSLPLTDRGLLSLYHLHVHSD